MLPLEHRLKAEYRPWAPVHKCTSGPDSDSLVGTCPIWLHNSQVEPDQHLIDEALRAGCMDSQQVMHWKEGDERLQPAR